jgi:hypothetical protein
MEAFQDGLAAIADVFQIVAGVIGQARAMRVEIADRDMCGHPGIDQPEPGQVRLDRRVPADHAARDLMRDDGRADRL